MNGAGQTCVAIRACALYREIFCGAERDRTDDLRLAKPALSQLSYSPEESDGGAVGQGRVELPTSRLSGVRSNHLSYWPVPVRDPLRRVIAFGAFAKIRGPPSGMAFRRVEVRTLAPWKLNRT